MNHSRLWLLNIRVPLRRKEFKNVALSETAHAESFQSRLKCDCLFENEEREKEREKHSDAQKYTGRGRRHCVSILLEEARVAG